MDKLNDPLLPGQTGRRGRGATSLVEDDEGGAAGTLAGPFGAVADVPAAEAARVARQRFAAAQLVAALVLLAAAVAAVAGEPGLTPALAPPVLGVLVLGVVVAALYALVNAWRVVANRPRPADAIDPADADVVARGTAPALWQRIAATLAGFVRTRPDTLQAHRVVLWLAVYVLAAQLAAMVGLYQDAWAQLQSALIGVTIITAASPLLIVLVWAVAGALRAALHDIDLWSGASTTVAAILVLGLVLVSAAGQSNFTILALVLLFALICIVGAVAWFVHRCTDARGRQRRKLRLLEVSIMGEIDDMLVGPVNVAGDDADDDSGDARLPICELALATLCLLLGLALAAAFTVVLAFPGYGVSQPAAPGLLVADPPPYDAVAWAYGSGADQHRAEFGGQLAGDARTPPLDLSAFITFSAVRTWFWGFSERAVPLNAYVHYPDTLPSAPNGATFPVVLIVHGNHEMTDFSDRGYEYLTQHWAGHGFIAASVDENFLNGNMIDSLTAAPWSADVEYPARALVLLEHMAQLRRWNETASHRFFGRVRNSFHLAGHSRGGEAVVHAAQFTALPVVPRNGRVSLAAYAGLRVDSLIALGGNDRDWLPAGNAAALDGVNFLSIQGAHDSDVLDFRGLTQFNRVRNPPDAKSAVFVAGANHGQFNTDWGVYDQGATGLFAWARHRGDFISGEAQRELTKTLTTALLTRDTAPLCDAEGAGALPEGVRAVSRCTTRGFEALATFTEDDDLTSTSWPGGTAQTAGFDGWHEARLFLRFPARTPDQDANGVFLQGAGTYRLSLPGLSLARTDTIALAAAIDPRFAIALDRTMATLRLRSADGNLTSATATWPIAPPYFVQLWKTSGLEPTQLVPGSARIGVEDLVTPLTNAEIARLDVVELVISLDTNGADAAFVRTQTVVLTDIGLYRSARRAS